MVENPFVDIFAIIFFALQYTNLIKPFLILSHTK